MHIYVAINIIIQIDYTLYIILRLLQIKCTCEGLNLCHIHLSLFQIT